MGDYQWEKQWFGVSTILGNLHMYVIYIYTYIYRLVAEFEISALVSNLGQSWMGRN